VRMKSFVEDLMYGRRRSPFIEAALYCASLPYGAIMRCRAALFSLRLLRRTALPCKVVSIGNITLGGAGKTPAVIALARLPTMRRKRAVVVSRGYGRKNESEILVVSDGRSILESARTGGDEPVLIAMRAEGTPVVVGSDRAEAARLALARFAPDCVILDDAFQHLKLGRNLDIALVDATDPFGNGRLFPAGILREPVSALKRAHAVLITHADEARDLEGLKGAIRRHTAARIFTSRHIPLDLTGSSSLASLPLTTLRGVKTLAFSGIARPSSFVALLKSLGADVVAELVYPDHYEYLKRDLDELGGRAAAAGAALIVTTEKDLVKIGALGTSDIRALRIELEFVEREAWEAFIAERI
jgi:tetraacyldisaccharide 4'-kinase